MATGRADDCRGSSAWIPKPDKYHEEQKNAGDQPIIAKANGVFLDAFSDSASQRSGRQLCTHNPDAAKSEMEQIRLQIGFLDMIKRQRMRAQRDRCITARIRRCRREKRLVIGKVKRRKIDCVVGSV